MYHSRMGPSERNYPPRRGFWSLSESIRVEMAARSQTTYVRRRASISTGMETQDMVQFQV